MPLSFIAISWPAWSGKVGVAIGPLLDRLGVPRSVSFMAKSRLISLAPRTLISGLGACLVIRGAHDRLRGAERAVAGD
jgi:hypothetical protein